MIFNLSSRLLYKKQNKPLTAVMSLILFFFTGMISSCYSGGKLVNNKALYDPQSTFTPEPTILLPAANPTYSKTNSVVISGACADGYTVFLKGAKDDSMPCSNSSYTFTFTANVDGVYSFLVSQLSPKQAQSKAISTVWIRKTSVSPPVLTSPVLNPFFSAQNTLVVTGNCESGATVALSGDGADQTVCVNSTFTLNLPKSLDGDYALQVTQTDLATNTASVNLTWKKRALIVSPLNPFLVVGTNQVFSISGGSGTYTTVLTANNSGGLYNSTNNTYTAGQTAAVVDTLTITDSVGTSAQIPIVTVAGAPDHLVMDTSTNLQSQTIGKSLAQSMKLKVTDAYGNGLPNFPVYARVVLGDGIITNNSVQFSDLNGNVQYQMKLGYNGLVNTVQVAPLGSPLPDVAGSGTAKLMFTHTGLSANQNHFGAIFSVGGTPGDMVSADFNEDGKLDIAVINTANSNLKILINKGNFLFDNPVSVGSICSGPSGLVAADFNGDGHIDIAVVCAGSDSITVTLGNGAGGFGSTQTFSVGPDLTNATSITAADFDHDGKVDLAISSITGAAVGVFKGLGNGSFNLTPLVKIVGQSPKSILAVDLNKDTWSDLVVLNSADNTMSVFMNNQVGGFGNENIFVTGTNPIQVIAQDLNADGWVDLVVLNNQDNTVSVYKNDQTGDLIPPLNYNVGSNSTSITAGDFNGDGLIDIAAISADDSTLAVLSGQAGGSFSGNTPLPTVNNPLYLISADINGDTKKDLILTGIADSNIQIFPAQANNELGFIFPVSSSPNGVTFGDFNGDGKMDMAVSSLATNTVQIFLGTNNGLFTNGVALTSTGGPDSLAANDLNGDGKTDLVVVNKNSGSVNIFLGNGDGTFASPATISAGSSLSAIQIKDMNGDGKLDLVLLSRGNNRVSVLLGAGDGSFGSSVGFNTADDPTDLVVSDFNGDGVLDIAVTSRTTAKVSVLIGNGDGTFQNHIVYPVGALPSSLVAADFNGDGFIDLAVANENDGTVTILNGVGDGSFGTTNIFACGNTPGKILLGDFNADGKVDLAVHNGADQTVTLLFGNGNGQFNTSSAFTITGTATTFSSTDLNNDGSSDFVILQQSDNAAHIWIGH